MIKIVTTFFFAVYYKSNIFLYFLIKKILWHSYYYLSLTYRNLKKTKIIAGKLQNGDSMQGLNSRHNTLSLGCDTKQGWSWASGTERNTDRVYGSEGWSFFLTFVCRSLNFCLFFSFKTVFFPVLKFNNRTQPPAASKSYFYDRFLPTDIIPSFCNFFHNRSMSYRWIPWLKE